LISFSDYVQFAATCNIKDLQDIIDTLNEISEVGSILYDSDPLLRNTIILDPKWLIDVMATLFTTKHRWLPYVILNHTNLIQIWKEYPPEIHYKLLQLLQQFEVAYTVQSKDIEEILKFL